MKILFAPYYVTNPYQPNLEKQLRILGHEILHAPIGVTQLFHDKCMADCDIIHMHWLHPYVLRGNYISVPIKILYFLSKIKRLKRSKKLVWTVHNISSHNRKFRLFERFYLKLFVKLVDGFSVHNEYSEEQLINRYKVERRKIYLIPHANYIDIYPPQSSGRNVRRLLGLDGSKKRIFMLFGYIRAYKGAMDVIAAFETLDDTKNQLIICGKIGDDQDLAAIEAAANRRSNITIYPKFIENKDIRAFFDLADIMLYPYRDITTSGSLILGMSLGKVCLCADVGDMKMLVGKDFAFKDKKSFENRLSYLSQLTPSELSEIGAKNYMRVKPFTWEKMARDTERMYLEIK